jgi:hypothetical protein
VLEASFFSSVNIKDSGIVGLPNGTTPHDRFPVDLGSAATMNNVTASGVLFHNCTTPHKGFRVDPSTSANNEMANNTQEFLKCISEKHVL